MKNFVLSIPNIRQPFVNGSWGFKMKPLPTFDKISFWREQSVKKGLSKEACLRLEWLIFYETVGKKSASFTACYFGIAKKTFYKWFKRFDDGRYIKGLENRSTKPKHLRTSELSLTDELRIKKLRLSHMHWGRNKIRVEYAKKYQGESTTNHAVEIVIRKHMLYPDQTKAEMIAIKRKRAKKKQRITKLTIRPSLWFLIHLDTIVIYWGSLKRYILTAIDHHGKFAYARCYNNKSSRTAKDFLIRLHYLLNAREVNVQTDNGSEFEGEFDTALNELNITHWYSRPYTPKDNAVVERFNQTLQYEWLNDGHFTTDINKLNQALNDWIIEYNFHRPHQALAYLTPIEYIEQNLDEKVLPMWSVRTLS